MDMVRESRERRHKPHTILGHGCGCRPLASEVDAANRKRHLTLRAWLAGGEPGNQAELKVS